MRRKWSRNYNLRQSGYPQEPIFPAAMATPQNSKPPRLPPLPNLIFASRWLQLPLYLGLIDRKSVV